MKINRLVIENFKSIERIELIEPNPFTVFVGPNGSGKSNIFEALEFVNLSQQVSDAVSLFGGKNALIRRQDKSAYFSFLVNADTFDIDYSDGMTASVIEGPISVNTLVDHSLENLDYIQFTKGFSRIFVRNNELVKLAFNGDQQLSLSAKNLEKVLKRTLSHPVLKNEIFEWLELFIPGFKAVEIDDRNELHWFEDSTPDYFTKDLISDGTYNILALLTAVYQSDDKPQFLCIEEPENGLHPQVVMALVDFFRRQCEEKGHYIWLNTHSESLVRKLAQNEIILVDKRNGATQIKQINNQNFYDLPTDEAWLTGALGGGLPW